MTRLTKLPAARSGSQTPDYAHRYGVIHRDRPDELVVVETFFDELKSEVPR
jgi:hypothetical protein